MNQTFMKEKKILPLVLSMSLPMVISMAVNSLYNIVDSYFVAKLSEDAMTALALVYPVQNLINAIAIGFGIGINASVAFSLGFVVSAVSVTCSGALEGLGKGAPSLYISMARYVVVILPAAYILSRFLGAEGVWYAFCVTEYMTAAIAYGIYRRKQTGKNVRGSLRNPEKL